MKMDKARGPNSMMSDNNNKIINNKKRHGETFCSTVIKSNCPGKSVKVLE
jgi:hypothetical protein